MINKLINHTIIRQFVAAISALILIGSTYSPAVLQAAKQSVNVNPSVYFTLDSVSLTAGTDSQAFNFTLNLTNQSGTNVDLNQYGVRVLDKDGNAFSAQLTEKASARVLAHQAQGFKYTAEVPSNISVGQLQVDVFAWDYNAATFMRDLGSLDAAPALAVKPADSSKQVVITLSDLDASLPNNTTASFTLLRSYKVLEKGVWSVYSELKAENLSTQAIQLPSNLLFNLRDDAQTYILTTLTSAVNPTIPAKQSALLKFQSVLKTPDTSHKLAFEFAKRPMLGVKVNNLLGSLSVDDSYVGAHIGSAVYYPAEAVNPLKIVATRATFTNKAFSNEINVELSLTNEGKTILPVPAIEGTYQVNNSTLTIGASESEYHPETLVPNQSTTYHFIAQFPKGTDESSLQLVLSANQLPIDLIALPISYSQAGEGGLSESAAFDMKDFDPGLSKNAVLSFQIVRSYHTVANGIPAVNIDLAAENQSAYAIKLPAVLLYNVADSDGLTYPTTAISGADQSIMPHQSIQFTLQAAIGKKDTSHQYSLALVTKSGSPNSAYGTFDLTSSFSNAKLNTPLNTSIGKLGVALKSTYRLATDSGDDILMSEVEIQNLDNKVVTLPNQAGTGLYGGYMMDDFDAQGKVIRIQTSPFLYPNQKTTVYIYTTIPYTSSTTNGYIYIGDGTLNNQTSVWTQTHEWTELPYTVNSTAISTIGLNSEWLISDTGRISTGQIVDSQIYNINNQKMLAVRILQTNKESRNGSIVPYTGYLANMDGSTLALKTTDDSTVTTKMSKEGTALSTLWALLPTGFSAANEQAVFGQKIDDHSFAEPLQYAFTSSTAPANGSISNASVYPFNISLQNAKLVFTSTGVGANAIAGYNINFDYAITKTLDAAGITKNRGLEFTLTDNSNKVVKTWDTALDGVGAWTTGANKLFFLNSDIPDLSTFISFAKTLNVYEKFEGGTRLIGTVAVTFY